ncbi:hypothetical protein JTB14_014697 [Gonioctena quinquepunctata]|nr:hypothetical protein JTB14_014697 [Gonioctena quinquepunctata]
MKWTIILFTSAAVALAEEDALQEFTEGNRRFSADLYKELLTTEKGNFIMSPFSAETILALTHEGARGETATEMVTGLHLPSTNEKIQKVFKTLLPGMTSSNEDLKMLSANKIYVGIDVKLENDFQKVAEDIYDSGIENVNFEENEAAAKTINGWVEDHTQKRIQNLIDPEIISGDTKMVLVNALYFKGVWQNPFSIGETASRKFHKSKGDTVNIDMMAQTNPFSYYECPKVNAKFLEMGYQGANVSMVFVLPNEIEGLATLEQNMEGIMKPQPLVVTRVAVQIPKFEMLGIRRVFGKRAELTGLSSTYKDLYASEVVQKAFINVNEAGTEAAASTDAMELSGLYGGVLRTEYFIADHPFAYFIKYNGVILFAGRYT